MMDRVEWDWLDDDTMSAEETLRRFEALEPLVVRGPRPGQHHFVPVTDDEGAPPTSDR